MFRDGTAHLKMNSFSSWSDEGANFYGLRRDLYKNYGYDAFNEELDKCREEHRLEVHLSHCSQDAYYYLRSLRTISSEGYDPRIVEPVTVPSNIIDGIGYVDIVNTTVARIELPAEEEHYIFDSGTRFFRLSLPADLILAGKLFIFVCFTNNT